MAGPSKNTSAVPDDIKNFIRSVLLSKPYGIKMNYFLNDYRELVGERLEFHKYGASNLEGLLKMMPDAVRLAELNGDKMIFGIPDYNSFQTISMKKASRALDKLTLGEGDQLNKPSNKNGRNTHIKSNGKSSYKNLRNSNKGKSNFTLPKSQSNDTEVVNLIKNDPQLKDDPRAERWLGEMQIDKYGRYSISVKERHGMTSETLQADFSKYGKVIQVHSIKGLYFVRFGSKVEVVRAMFNLRTKYDVSIAKTKKPKMENVDVSDVDADVDAIVDVCIENLPPNINKEDISELLYLAKVPPTIVTGHEVFSKTTNSFAYLRVKGMDQAQKLMIALQQVNWQGHKVTAKMPQHASLSFSQASPGPKRKVIDKSSMMSYSGLLQSKPVPNDAKVESDDALNDDDDSDDDFDIDIDDMPELEMSTYEDDEAFMKRTYGHTEEDVPEEEEYDEDEFDDLEMPELEPLPTARSVPVLGSSESGSPDSESVHIYEPPPISQDTGKTLSKTLDTNGSNGADEIKKNIRYPGSGGACKPVLTVKNFPSKTTKAELVELFAPYNPRCVFRLIDNYKSLAGKVTFWNMESLFQAYTDLNGTMFKGKELVLYRSDTQASKSANRIKEARSLSCTVSSDNAGDSKREVALDSRAIDPTYRPNFLKLQASGAVDAAQHYPSQRTLRPAKPGLLPNPVFPVPVAQGRLMPITGAVPTTQHDGTFFMIRDMNLVVNQVMNTCFPGIPFWCPNDIPENFEVMVTCVMNFWHPSIFWGQLISKDAREDVKTLLTLQEAFPRAVMPYHPGMPYCAAQNMGEWRRACVLGNLPHGKVKVFFIDYGNCAVLNKSQVRNLPDHYWNLPPQAVPFMAVANYVGGISNDEILVACKKPPPRNFDETNVIVPVSIVLRKKGGHI